MSKDETYLKMCEKAPREITAIVDTLDPRQTRYCTHHKEFLYESYGGEYRCLGMDKKQSEIQSRPVGDRTIERLWRELQKSDDWCEGKHWIRIPTQEDLQEIIASEYEGGMTPRELGNLVESFSFFVTFGGYKFTSMNQLWLAFITKTKLAKLWNMEDWVDF